MNPRISKPFFLFLMSLGLAWPFAWLTFAGWVVNQSYTALGYFPFWMFVALMNVPIFAYAFWSILPTQSPSRRWAVTSRILAIIAAIVLGLLLMPFALMLFIFLIRNQLPA